MGIETIIAMIPKGGKYAKSVVNFVHKVPQNWEKFKSAIQQIDDILKQGKLRLDGKQKTIFESNKNILKNYEKVNKDAYAQYDKAVKDKKNFIDKSAQITDDLFKGKVTKDTADLFKGWTPTLVERSNLRNVYKDLDPPTRLYTKEMEAIDEELDALVFGGDKYRNWSDAEKAKLFKKLQAAMKKLIDKAVKEDLSTLSLSQINKKRQNLQKRIREIADNQNIKGTVHEGPKADMIAAIYDSENAALTNARNIIKRRNSELKYGKKFPILDPENDAFIIYGLDSSGNPMKVGRWRGRFSATKDTKTGDLTSKEGTSYYDTWDPVKNTVRKEGEEVFHKTVDREGKVIMSNPDYKVTTKNMEIWNEIYRDTSISDLSKKGYTLKDIDMLMKGKQVNKYLKAQEAAEKGLDIGIKTQERTSTHEIYDLMEDLYHRGDDVYKMSMKEWITKIPEHFAGGGRVAYGEGSGGISNFFKNKLKKYTREGIDEAQEKWLMEKGLDMTLEEWQAKSLFEKLKIAGKRNLTILPGVDDLEKGIDYATGGVANLFRQRQGYRDAGSVIKLVKGARWLIRMLKEMSDDMIFGHGKFANMAEALKMKYFKQTEAAIKSLESGGPIPDEILTNLRNDARFKDLTVSKTADKDFIEMQEVVLGKTSVEKTTAEKLFESKEDLIKNLTHDFKGKPYKDVVQTVEGTVVDDTIDLMTFKKELPADIIANLNKLPIESQTALLKTMKQAFDAAKKGNIESGVDVLQKDLLEQFIPKGKPHATGGLIDGYATGGVSNLFRSR